MTKVMVGLAEYKLKEYEDSRAEYCLIDSNTASFPVALYLDEPQGNTLFASLPEFTYRITESESRHVCDMAHLGVYTAFGQEVDHFTWEPEQFEWYTD